MRDLQKDLEICQAATSGPWYPWESPSGVQLVNCGCYPAPTICRCYSTKGKTAYDMRIEAKANADFIAAAREGWPEAIRRAMAAETKVRTAKEALKKLENLLLLPEFSELDGRIWRIIDNALAALEGGERE